MAAWFGINDGIGEYIALYNYYRIKRNQTVKTKPRQGIHYSDSDIFERVFEDNVGTFNIEEAEYSSNATRNSNHDDANTNGIDNKHENHKDTAVDDREGTTTENDEDIIKTDLSLSPLMFVPKVWYYNVSKADAEEMLQNWPKGTFLIRPFDGKYEMDEALFCGYFDPEFGWTVPIEKMGCYRHKKNRGVSKSAPTSPSASASASASAIEPSVLSTAPSSVAPPSISAITSATRIPLGVISSFEVIESSDGEEEKLEVTKVPKGKLTETEKEVAKQNDNSKNIEEKEEKNENEKVNEFLCKEEREQEQEKENTKNSDILSGSGVLKDTPFRKRFAKKHRSKSKTVNINKYDVKYVHKNTNILVVSVKRKHRVKHHFIYNRKLAWYLKGSTGNEYPSIYDLCCMLKNKFQMVSHGLVKELECQVCFCEYSHENCKLKRTMPCPCLICFDCMGDYIQSEVYRRVVDIPCPGETCRLTLEEDFVLDTIQNYVSNENLDGIYNADNNNDNSNIETPQEKCLRQFITFKTDIESDPNAKTCPNCGSVTKRRYCEWEGNDVGIVGRDTKSIEIDASSSDKNSPVASSSSGAMGGSKKSKKKTKKEKKAGNPKGKEDVEEIKVYYEGARVVILNIIDDVDTSLNNKNNENDSGQDSEFIYNENVAMERSNSNSNQVDYCSSSGTSNNNSNNSADNNNDDDNNINKNEYENDSDNNKSNNDSDSNAGDYSENKENCSNVNNGNNNANSETNQNTMINYDNNSEGNNDNNGNASNTSKMEKKREKIRNKLSLKKRTTKKDKPGKIIILQQEFIACDACDFHWCFECHSPQHAGITCKDNNKTGKKSFQWKKKKARTCPNCKVPIQRNKGCDHMVCVMCKTDFCYICGKPYVNGAHVGSCKMPSMRLRVKAAVVTGVYGTVIAVGVIIIVPVAIIGTVGYFAAVGATSAYNHLSNNRGRRRNRTDAPPRPPPHFLIDDTINDTDL